MLKSLKLTKICSLEIMLYVCTKLSVFEIQAKKQPYNVQPEVGPYMTLGTLFKQPLNLLAQRILHGKY